MVVALCLVGYSYGYGKRGGKRWSREHFELLLVLIDGGLEEPSDLVWL